MVAVPLIWSILALALADRLLRCTPVARALMLVISNWPVLTLLALMSIALMSLAASWVRNGQPSMLTDGLVLSPDVSIFCATWFSAIPLAIWSPMARIARISTRITVSTTQPR